MINKIPACRDYFNSCNWSNKLTGVHTDKFSIYYVNFLELENVSFLWEAHGIVYYPSIRLSLLQIVVLTETETGKNIYVAR